MSLVISSRAAARWLGVLVSALVALDLAHHVLYRVFHRDYAFGFHTTFALSGEQNVPTWYASATLLLCGALFSLIAHAKRAAADPFAHHWQGLGAIFVVLSLDEAAALHDGLNRVATALGSGGGAFRWGWVLFAMAAVLGVGATYLRFFLALAPRFQRLFLASAVLFVGGAVGCEMLGAAQWRDDADWQSLGYALTSTLEETLEMCGIALLIYALLSYITATLPSLTVRFHGAAAPPAEPGRPPVPTPAYSPMLTRAARREATREA